VSRVIYDVTVLGLQAYFLVGGRGADHTGLPRKGERRRERRESEKVSGRTKNYGGLAPPEVGGLHRLPKRETGDWQKKGR